MVIRVVRVFKDQPLEGPAVLNGTVVPVPARIKLVNLKTKMDLVTDGRGSERISQLQLYTCLRGP